MSGTVVLAPIRPARYEDGYALWLWANDATTRRWSGDREPIHFEQHMLWFAHRLADLGTLLLIAENESATPLGSVRFESNDQWRTARLSYVVAPRFRGQGYSRPLVTEAMRCLGEAHPRTGVWAEVMTGNVASLKVFRGLEWNEEAGTAGQRKFWWRP